MDNYSNADYSGCYFRARQMPALSLNQGPHLPIAG